MVQPISVDVFVPRFAAGARELLQQRLAPLRGANISFVSVGGASPAANLAFALDLAKQYDLRVQLQLDCKMSKEEAGAVLKNASAVGIVNLLLLRSTASNRGFEDVLELVRFVAKASGLFRISVSGYPRGTKGEIGLYSKDVALTAEQVKAGAHVVLCSPVFDINHFVQYDGDLKRAGVAEDVAIQPSLVPLHAFGKRGELFRAVRSLGWVLPKKVEADVLTLQEQKDPRALAAMGEWLFVCLFLELTRRCPQLEPHVLTMNAAASIDALRAVGVLPSLANNNGNAAADGDVSAASDQTPTANGAVEESGANGSQSTAKKLLHILHGGNLSLEIAELVSAEAAQHGHTARLVSMETFKKWAAETELMSPTHDTPIYAIFIVETVENEQPSEGAGACVRLLNRRTHEQGCLSRLVYAVLGLGDSNLLLDRQTTTAADCNQVAQRMDKRLAELGGTAFLSRGEADDRTGNTEIQPWVAQLWETLAH